MKRALRCLKQPLFETGKSGNNILRGDTEIKK
jgi:hypothetical protein